MTVGGRSSWLAASQWCAKEVLASALAAWWSRREPAGDPLPVATIGPSDHVQRAMNLVFPLRRPSLVTRSKLTRALVQATDEVLTGLNNVGTVHFARFDLIDGNLCMFSIYDGDMSGYVRDFIATIGNAFEGLFVWVKDPPVLPIETNVDEFVAWVQAHDAFQMPEQPTGLIGRNLTTLPRDTVLALHRHRNVQLGLYRAYPGYSAAQVRHHLSVGW